MLEHETCIHATHASHLTQKGALFVLICIFPICLHLYLNSWLFSDLQSTAKCLNKINKRLCIKMYRRIICIKTCSCYRQDKPKFCYCRHWPELDQILATTFKDFANYSLKDDKAQVRLVHIIVVGNVGLDYCIQTADIGHFSVYPFFWK